MIGTYSLGILGGYAVALTLADSLQFFSERINSQEELERVVEEEASKLDLPTKRIISEYSEAWTPAKAGLLGYDAEQDEFVSAREIDEKQVFGMNTIRMGGWGARRATVRHELYHIKHHLKPERQGRIAGKLRSFFLEEPAAVLYSLTGVETT